MSKRLLKLVEKGLNNKQIAETLGVCARTVQRHKVRSGIPDPTPRKRSGRKPKIK